MLSCRRGKGYFTVFYYEELTWGVKELLKVLSLEFIRKSLNYTSVKNYIKKERKGLLCLPRCEWTAED